ncbi:MAG: EI24 domain-containing protein [Bacteroidia bacterium]|nr:EI24 domain-containing protein [Bacteroidia bacterium]
MRNVFSQVWIGLAAYFRSVIFVVKHGLWLYFLVPAILSVLVWWGGDLTLRQLRTENFQNLADDEIDRYLIIGLQSLFVYVAFKLNKYLVMILLSPVLTQLSARTERLLTANVYPFRFKQYLHNLLRGLQIAFRNLFLQMIIILLWLTFAAFIPNMQAATPVIVIIIGFYFYGFYFMDYVSERLGYSLDESVTFIRKNAALSFTIGGIFTALFLIPYAGVIIAPVLASVASTIAVDRVVGLKNVIRGRFEKGEKGADPRSDQAFFSKGGRNI